MRNIRVGTLKLSNLNFPRFLVPYYFNFKANFQSNQVAISGFQGTIPGFQGAISGFQGIILNFQGTIPDFQGVLRVFKVQFWVFKVQFRVFKVQFRFYQKRGNFEPGKVEGPFPILLANSTLAMDLASKS